MRKVFNLILWLIVVVLFSGSVLAGGSKPEKRLYQVSTLQALLAGGYDGSVSLGVLLENGSMGLGTFDKLAGEMILWEGVIYQGRVDGKVYKVASSVTTPFANAAFPGSSESFTAKFEGGYDALKKKLDECVPPCNKPILFCITGKFKDLTYRSVPAQNKPYRPLAEVVKEQAVFEKEYIEGMIVGFRFPDYFKGINATGYHLHFLSKDKTMGGHLFGVESGEITVNSTVLSSLELILPDTISMAKLDSIDADKDVEAVEKLEK